MIITFLFGNHTYFVPSNFWLSKFILLKSTKQNSIFPCLSIYRHVMCKEHFREEKNQDHMLTSLNQEINKIWQISPKSRSNYNHIPSQTNHLLIRTNIWCIKNFDYRITRTLNIYSYVLINKEKFKKWKKTYLFGFGRYYIQLPFHMLISDRSIEIKMI